VYVNDLSFDPAHRWFPVPGWPGIEWAVEVFTVNDALGPAPTACTFDGARMHATGLQWLGGQRERAGTVDAETSTDGDVARWRITANAPDLVKGIKLLLRGLPSAALDAGWWTPTTPSGDTLTPTPQVPVALTYPWESWQTPWVCAGESGPAVTLSVRDDTVRPKRFHVSTPHWSPVPVVEIVCDELATRRATTFTAPEIRLRVCATESDIRLDLVEHLSALEGMYGLIGWAQRTDVPAWADDLDLVLTLHGQHWTGHVFNTFDQMAAILRDITTDLPGERILAYLPGWEGRYYWQYPQYGPGVDLGGEEGFARLVATAARLGVHLMPMFGANGAHVERYPNWEASVLRSPSNRYTALINAPDWDNDRAGEDEQVFLNPGEPAFRAHLLDQVSNLVARYAVAGVFLDTSACWFNDPRFDVYDGYRDLVTELHRRHPQLLLCGEGWYDALLALFPMNQTWLPMASPPRYDDLPMRYARVLGHLHDGAPGTGSTGVHEGGTRPIAQPLHIPGYVPALSVVSDTFTHHREAVREFCHAVAKETR
jgi:hypothetical protein